MSIADNLVTIAENVPKVYDAGKAAGIEADRKAFWEAYQDGGDRSYHMYTFYGEFWTDKTYNPIYPVKIRTNNTNAFYQCGATDSKVVIDIGAYDLNNTFRYAKFITMKIKIVEGANPQSAFTNMSALKNLTVTGTIGKSFNISSSPLTAESGKNLITALKDYAGTASEYTYTLTLNSTCWTALDAEGATAPGGVTWREYVSVKGWKAA